MPYDFKSQRLFLDAPLATGASASLGRDQAHYLLNVLRLADGAEILVFNGRDGEWLARIARMGKREAALEFVERIRSQTALPDLHYCFAPLKHARLDYLAQKAVEMGAAVLQPVLTQHSQAARVNMERMRANAIEAAEQCGVIALAEVREPTPLAGLIEVWDGERRLIFCDEAAQAPALDALRAVPAGPLALLVGPEGGFSAAERALLLDQPFVTVLSLGPRILRADTAAVAALALVQSVLGDWR